MFDKSWFRLNNRWHLCLCQHDQRHNGWAIAVISHNQTGAHKKGRRRWKDTRKFDQDEVGGEDEDWSKDGDMIQWQAASILTYNLLDFRDCS